MPNLRRYDESTWLAWGWVLPSWPAARMVPMLLDLASTPFSVRYQVAWSMSSWKSRSPRCSRLGTVTCVSGVAAFSSRTAAIDMTFAVEPGSYASWSAALPMAVELACERSLGSKPGALAIARTSPVLVSCTIT